MTKTECGICGKEIHREEDHYLQPCRSWKKYGGEYGKTHWFIGESTLCGKNMVGMHTNPASKKVDCRRCIELQKKPR